MKIVTPSRPEFPFCPMQEEFIINHHPGPLQAFVAETSNWGIYFRKLRWDIKFFTR